MADRTLIGYVVRFPVRQGGLGLDAYLARKGETDVTVCFSLDTALVFGTDAGARLALAEYGEAQPLGHLPGRVDKVYEETRRVLGGESTDDLNDLLHKLQKAKPSDRDPLPADGPR